MLVVFDLDFTLWDAGGTWCDHTSAPYRKQNGYIIDSEDRRIVLYPEVRSILESLHERGISMALASRTHSPGTAKLLLELLGIDHYFDFRQIYPGSKIKHFRSLQQESSIPYEDMYFFDDEFRNIEEVKRLGVQTQIVNSGMTWKEIRVIKDLRILHEN